MINLGDPEAAIRNFEISFDLWNKTLRRFPRFAKEEVGDEVFKGVNRYKRLLETELDDSFPLKWFVDYRNSIDVEVLGADTNVEVEKNFKAWSEEQKRLDDLEESGDSQPAPTTPVPTTPVPTEPAPTEPPVTTDPGK
jgi:hypothetical protein